MSHLPSSTPEPEFLPQDDDTGYHEWLKTHASELADRATAKERGQLQSDSSTDTGRGGYDADDRSAIPTAPATGWGAFAAFRITKTTATSSTNTTPGSHSLLTPFFIILALIGIGYYTYTQVSAARTTISQTLDTSVNLENGLVGHWTFDGPDIDWGSTTAEIRDVSGNSYHGNAQGGLSTYSTVTGRLGQALEFEGTVNRLVYVPADLPIENTAALSSCLWIKSSFDPSIYVLEYENVIRFRKIDTSEQMEVRVFGDSNKTVRSAVPVATGEWTHVCATYEANDDVYLYVNGELSVGYEGGTGVPTLTGSTANPLTIGGLDASETFMGGIDDVRFYNRVLTVKEIRALYNLGAGSKISATPDTPDNLQTGLVGHWTFDGPDLTTATATDKSGNGNHGTLVNGPKPGIGKIGQGLIVNGGNGYVNAGSASSLDNISRITLAAWIRPDRLVDQDIFISKGAHLSLMLCSSTGGCGFDNNLYFRRRFSSSPSVGWVTPQDSIREDQWNHVIVTYDNTLTANDPIIYINGIKQSITELSGPPTGSPDSDALSNLLLGSLGYGTLDDVRIYNRILSAAEVRQLYELGVGSKIEICKETSVQDADGNTYNTIAIGSQCWLDRNMNVGTRINVSTTQTDNGTIEKYCHGNSPSNCTTNNPNKPDGGLYQWNEAMQYSTTEGARGICPVGFHIPTDAEWHALEKFLKNSGQTCDPNRSVPYDCASAGIALQPNGSSRFEGNLAGYTFVTSSFSRGGDGFFWSSSESGTNAWVRQITLGNTGISRSASTKAAGVSVRCIQD